MPAKCLRSGSAGSAASTTGCRAGQTISWWRRWIWRPGGSSRSPCPWSRATGDPPTEIGFSRKCGLHYGLLGGANDLLVAEVDLETGRLLSEPVPVVSRYGRPTYRPEWSPDGRYLAYAVKTSSILARDGALRVVVRDMETGREREMGQGFRTLDGVPRWRPDGKTLLAYGLPADGGAKTLQLDVADGSASPLPGSQNWKDGCAF